MPLNLPYLSHRSGHSYFRRRIPAALKQFVGLSEWKIGLGYANADPKQLMAEVRALAFATDSALAAASRGETIDKQLLANCLAEMRGIPTKENSFTFEQALDCYLRERRLPKLAKAEEMSLKQFRGWFSGEVLSDAKRRDIRLWIDWLRTVRAQSQLR